MQKVLGIVEADWSVNIYTECVKLESQINHASLLVDVVAVTATIGNMSVVAKQTTKREQAVCSLSGKVTTDISVTLQFSAKTSQQK